MSNMRDNFIDELNNSYFIRKSKMDKALECNIEKEVVHYYVEDVSEAGDEFIKTMFLNNAIEVSAKGVEDIIIDKLYDIEESTTIEIATLRDFFTKDITKVIEYYDDNFNKDSERFLVLNSKLHKILTKTSQYKKAVKDQLTEEDIKNGKLPKYKGFTIIVNQRRDLSQIAFYVEDTLKFNISDNIELIKAKDDKDKAFMSFRFKFGVDIDDKSIYKVQVG